MNEIDLNDLAIKTDSLPDNWKMLLIDPTTGLPAKNMTVARFTEFLTVKIPVATDSSNGLMGSQSVFSNPSHPYLYRTIVRYATAGSKSIRLKFNKIKQTVSCSIKVYGTYESGFAGGYIEKMIGFFNNPESGIISTHEYAEQVVACSDKTNNIYYISGVFIDNEGFRCIDIVNKFQTGNTPLIIFESYIKPDFEFLTNQTPDPSLLSKSNYNEFVGKSYSLEPNALTEAIPLNNNILPPPANYMPNYSESASSDEQFAVSAMSETDNPDGSTPVRNESYEVQEQHVWSIDKIGHAVLELQEENKRLKQILNISDDNEVQQM